MNTLRGNLMRRYDSHIHDLLMDSIDMIESGMAYGTSCALGRDAAGDVLSNLCAALKEIDRAMSSGFVRRAPK
jgi:hypothetical protein